MYVCTLYTCTCGCACICEGGSTCACTCTLCVWMGPYVRFKSRWVPCVVFGRLCPRKEWKKKGSIGAIIRWNKTHLGCFKRDPTVLESMLYCPQRIFATSIDQMGSMWGPFVLFWDDNYSNYPYGSQVVSVWDIWAPPSPDKSQMGPIFSATWGACAPDPCQN